MSARDDLAQRRAARIRHRSLQTVPSLPEFLDGAPRPIHAAPVGDGVSLNIAGWYITLSLTEAQRLAAVTTTALGGRIDLEGRR